MTGAWLVAEITLEKFALLSFKASDGFFLYLAYSFACKVKFCSDFFKCHFLTAYSEEHLKYLAFAVVQLSQCSVDLF